MDVIAPVAGQPSFDSRKFVGGIVVRDQMDLEPGRNVAVEMIKEGEEFLVAMARRALGDDRTVEHVKCREQGRGRADSSRGSLLRRSPAPLAAPAACVPR